MPTHVDMPPMLLVHNVAEGGCNMNEKTEVFRQGYRARYAARTLEVTPRELRELEWEREIVFIGTRTVSIAIKRICLLAYHHSGYFI